MLKCILVWLLLQDLPFNLRYLQPIWAPQTQITDGGESVRVVSRAYSQCTLLTVAFTASLRVDPTIVLVAAATLVLAKKMKRMYFYLYSYSYSYGSATVLLLAQ